MTVALNQQSVEELLTSKDSDLLPLINDALLVGRNFWCGAWLVNLVPEALMALNTCQDVGFG